MEAGDGELQKASRELREDLGRQGAQVQELLSRLGSAGGAGGANGDVPSPHGEVPHDAYEQAFGSGQLPLLAAALRRVEGEADVLRRRLEAEAGGEEEGAPEELERLRGLRGRLQSQADELRGHMEALRSSGQGRRNACRGYLRAVYCQVGLRVACATAPLGEEAISGQLQAAEERLRLRTLGEIAQLRAQVEDQSRAVVSRVEVLAGECRELRALCGNSCEVQSAGAKTARSVSMEDLNGFTPRQETAALGQRLAAVERYVDDRLARLQGVRQGLHHLAVFRGPPSPQTAQRAEAPEQTGGSPPTDRPTDERVAVLEQRYLSMLEALVSS